MAASSVIRRLSAVLVADVVGYSRLVENDEEHALSALQLIHDEIVTPTVKAHHGRIVKLMGDGILAEFSSVLDAVRQALAMQNALAGSQSDVREDRRITFRIGINLGDVIVDGDDILGDGVNVAARLERLAPPGGLCISDSVREQVGHRIDAQFEDMGEQKLRNIERVIRVWRWTGADSATTGEEGMARRCAARGHPAAQYEASVMDRPAVLFLPFEPLGSSDAEMVLASGLCEDIRTTLACWRWFPVIGPEAVRGEKGDLRTLAASVEAAFVVTGSVRRGGGRARVTARLLDASTCQELWSHSFDGSLEDIFDFQEDVSRRIVSQIEPQIARAAATRIRRARPRDLSCWELMAEAVEAERQGGDGYGTPQSNEEQRRLALRALDLDPGYSDAWARLARCHIRDFLLGWADDRAAALKASLDASAKAVETNPESSFARSCRAQCMLFGNMDPLGALEHAEEAVRLNPSDVYGHVMMGCVLSYCGEPDRGYAHYETALRLNPNFPNMGVVLCDQMMCRALSGRLEEAALLARKMMTAAPKYLRGLQRCAAVLSHAGNDDEAARVLETIDAMGGAFSEGYIRDTYPFVREQDLQFLISGLRKAGWNG
ncbi:adenylate/guanylate cyclase domain-containing protein [Limibaculum sp. FT325]|uniref:adenylate/guanylate cyclase domain-containing protein n=1 Tax=Thermohalobaculum sediminis TaxID=2939436 RepID=UPI0020C03793|nr:adenylate/guanylate cyclase domain-containing protein [Limibaculum sediminis]MCL5779312.1 adenylate/guanylate cyclase domain-containing protein [Limibaculum sediminis]